MPWSANAWPACSKFSDDCSSAFDGMQPTLVHVPPGAGLPPARVQSSMQAVLKPSCARADRGDVAAGAGADHDDVELFSHGRSPTRRPHRVEQQPRRIFERFLDRDQRQHRLAAVDDPVVVRLREVVHRPHDDLPVLDHRAVLRRVDAEDRRLRRIDDRRRQHRAEHAAVADRVRAAGQLLDRELAVLRALAEVGDLLLDLGDRHLVGVAQDRHDEAARAAHRDADVEIAVVDDVGAVDRRVDRRDTSSARAPRPSRRSP